MGILEERVAEVMVCAEDLLTEEEQKLFEEHIPYALSLTRLYPYLDQGELSSIAYHAVLRALKGYSLQKGKKYYDPSKGSLKTLINNIFTNEVNKYLSEESKRKKREPYLEELKKVDGEGEEVPIEEIIPAVGEVPAEDSTEWGIINRRLKETFSGEDYDVVMLVIDGLTYNEITEEINKKYHKGKPMVLHRYLRHIKLNILPKLEQILGEEVVEEVPSIIVSPDLVPA